MTANDIRQLSDRVLVVASSPAIDVAEDLCGASGVLSMLARVRDVADERNDADAARTANEIAIAILDAMNAHADAIAALRRIVAEAAQFRLAVEAGQ